MATVRITDEVNAAYKAKAKHDPQQRSVTQLVDEQLRRGAGLPIDGEPAAPAEVVAPPDPRARRATMARPRARRDHPQTTRCPHPIGRRIGTMCAACGASV